jgi:hypothetical protein
VCVCRRERESVCVCVCVRERERVCVCRRECVSERGSGRGHTPADAVVGEVDELERRDEREREKECVCV